MQDMSTMRKRTHAQELVELKTGKNLPDLLRDMYVVQGQTEVAMAKELGVSRITLRIWLVEFGVKKERAA